MQGAGQVSFDLVHAQLSIPFVQSSHSHSSTSSDLESQRVRNTLGVDVALEPVLVYASCNRLCNSRSLSVDMRTIETHLVLRDHHPTVRLHRRTRDESRPGRS